MKRRSQVAMTSEEQHAFLNSRKTITLSTIDGKGYPHAVAMWYAMAGDDILMTTFAKSQKAVNIRRNPKVAVMAESGETYETLKGVLVRGKAELIADVEGCVDVIVRVNEKMLGMTLAPEAIDMIRKGQATKRVVIKVTPEHVSSWDHTKLGGIY
ncbi:MAG: pyridoxamine 5'-phosphate oxidase family protein [Candidatus Binatia bacterium]